MAWVMKNTQWQERHSDVVACNAVEPPDSRIHRQYSSCCVDTELTKYDVDRESFQNARKLLLHVNRAIQDVYKSIQKHICPEARHPLLLARATGVEGPSERSRAKGWLLTRATFKPKTVDGIALSLPTPILRAQCVLKLSSKKVEQTERDMPAFVCIDRMSLEVAAIEQKFPEGVLQYCYNPPYRIDRTNMRRLVLLDEPRWVSTTGIDGEAVSDSDGGNDTADQQEDMDEIHEMLERMQGIVGKEPVPKKAPKRAARKRQTQTHEGQVSN